jgi:hypothetical protein
VPEGKPAVERDENVQKPDVATIAPVAGLLERLGTASSHNHDIQPGTTFNHVGALPGDDAGSHVPRVGCQTWETWFRTVTAII